MTTKTIEIECTLERASVETGVIIKLGLDVHATQITVCRQTGGMVPQPAQKRSWTELVALAAQLVAGGARVYSCYEAGPCGYGLHRRLTALGVTNFVVVPRRWDEQGQRVKTDKRDARELCLRLDRYVQGNTAAFSVVRVPTPEQEQRRAIGRQRGALLKERARSIVRGHGLMLAQGFQAPAQWWQPKVWAWLRQELPEWLREQVHDWQQQAERLDQELARWTARVEQCGAGQSVPKGVGPSTAGLLQMEILTWQRFQNRRQVASYTGLCPSERSTGSKRQQGGVNKHGNPRVRHQLVEAVWRLLRWQPQYPPLQKLRAASGPRARKRLAVAAARRLAIDLWRINTGQCPAEKLGLKLA
ncbi:MAG TPA: IS110 family transposase [Opitutaceae bacterium]|nr:IS110 family transposase [Opitutaceae bacterium]